MGAHGCVGGCFCFGIRCLSSTKASNNKFRISIAWLGVKILLKVGVKSRQQICNVYQNIGLILVFSE
jgi:hypothetical protein